MIKVKKYSSLGQANFGWLEARHHFSFGNYYDPERLGFGKLRMVNDDIVKPNSGFDTHPHRNMEIITYVRQGAITHKDSQGNVGRTEAGDVQVMSAGSGILHSEHNFEASDTVLYQIWIEPNANNIKPRWEQKQFPRAYVSDSLNVLASGTKSAGLFINQNATVYGGKMTINTSIKQPIEQQAYILVSDGSVVINGEPMAKGDGAEVTAQPSLEITAITEAEVLVIDIPS